MIAVIESGGKQFCVQPGATVKIDRIVAPAGETITFPDLLGGGVITATVVESRLAPKVRVAKFRPKTRYRRWRGHRQPITLIRISDPTPDTSAKRQPTRRVPPKTVKELK